MVICSEPLRKCKIGRKNSHIERTSFNSKSECDRGKGEAQDYIQLSRKKLKIDKHELRLVRTLSKLFYFIESHVLGQSIASFLMGFTNGLASNSRIQLLNDR